MTGGLSVDDVILAMREEISDETIDRLISETEYRTHFPVREGYESVPMSWFRRRFALARIRKFLLPKVEEPVLIASQACGMDVE